MPSGWTRWLLEQFEFPFEVVFPKTLDAGNLQAKFDVLIFVDGAHSARCATAAAGGGGSRAPRRIPAEFRDWLGRVTRREDRAGARRVRRERRHVLTIGSSTALGHHLGLPIRNALVERIASGVERPLPREKFYIPGIDSRGARRHDASARLRHGRARR